MQTGGNELPGGGWSGGLQAIRGSSLPSWGWLGPMGVIQRQGEAIRHGEQGPD